MMLLVKFVMTFHVDPESVDRRYTFDAKLPALPKDYEHSGVVFVGPRQVYVQEMELNANSETVVLHVAEPDTEDFREPEEARALEAEGWVRQ